MECPTAALPLKSAALLLGIGAHELERLIAQGFIPVTGSASARQVALEDLRDYEIKHRVRKERSLATLLALGRRIGLSARELADITALLAGPRVH